MTGHAELAVRICRVSFGHPQVLMTPFLSLLLLLIGTSSIRYFSRPSGGFNLTRSDGTGLSLRSGYEGTSASDEIDNDMEVADGIIGLYFTRVVFMDLVVEDLSDSVLSVQYQPAVMEVDEETEEFAKFVIDLMLPHLVAALEKSIALCHMFGVQDVAPLRQSGPKLQAFKQLVTSYMIERSIRYWASDANRVSQGLLEDFAAGFQESDK